MESAALQCSVQQFLVIAAGIELNPERDSVFDELKFFLPELCAVSENQRYVNGGLLPDVVLGEVVCENGSEDVAVLFECVVRLLSAL